MIRAARACVFPLFLLGVIAASLAVGFIELHAVLQSRIDDLEDGLKQGHKG